MTQYDNKVSIRILGIHMSPVLSWDREFQEIRIKMKETIGKLSNTLMTVQLTHLHVNSYLMSKVYFGYGIMELIDE